MKKLLRLIGIIACMGCSSECDSASSFDDMFECYQPDDESCGFLQGWDECTSACEWVF